MPSQNSVDLSSQKIKDEIALFNKWFEERSGSFSRWSKVVAFTLGILSALITIYVFFGLKFGYLSSSFVLLVVLCMLYIPFMLRKYMALSMIKFMGLSITTFQQVIDKVEADTGKSRRDIDAIVSEFKDTMIKVEQSMNAASESVAAISPRLEATVKQYEENLLLKLEDAVKNIEAKAGTIQLSTQEFEDKFERMKKKYSQVHFKDMQSTNEFNESEANAVKIGLMRGVQHRVHAIYRIEKYLPLPMDPQDDLNYFEDNKRAFDRILNNHPSSSDREEYNIHRIFIIPQEILEDPALAEKVKLKIKEHDEAGFDARVARKEDLAEPPTYEFAIYDDEITLRLSINQALACYGEGIVYFDDAVLRDIYRRRYKEIEAESCKPDEFWRRHPIRHINERNQ